MRSITQLVLNVWSLTSLPNPLSPYPSNSKGDSDFIDRDVAIIGGGAAGTYAAVRLHDLGYKVVLVEQQAQLGGHVNTYTDTENNIAIDYGVGDYRKLPVTEQFLNRLKIPFNDMLMPNGGDVLEVDLRSTRNVTDYPKQSVRKAFELWRQQVVKFPELEHGYYLPDPVPEDLLLPFGEFVEKYNISGLVQVAFTSYGDILTKPTLYVMKYFGPNGLKNLESGFYGTVSRNNSQIYAAAADILQGDVLLNSKVVSTLRTGKNNVTVNVKTPAGLKQIRARKLIIAIPPLVPNLAGFDLHTTESELFRQFKSVGYYTSLVRHTGIPENLTVRNVAAGSRYNLPHLPGVYHLAPMGPPGIFEVEYGSDYSLPESVVKADIILAIKMLQMTHFPSSGSSFTSKAFLPEFLAFNSHTPYLLTVPAQSIRDGFYKKLYALQGERDTFYTGAAFHAHDSALLWRFTEALLPEITSALKK